MLQDIALDSPKPRDVTSLMAITLPSGVEALPSDYSENGRFGFSRALGSYLRSNRAAATAPFVIFYVDIDGLDNVNSRYGPLAGDAAINWVSEQLRIVSRKVHGCDNFVLRRVGGDEFAIGFHLTGCDSKNDAQVKKIAADICVEIADAVGLAHFWYGESLVQIDVSVGATVSPNGKSEDIFPNVLLDSVSKAAQANQRAKHTAGEHGPVHDPHAEVLLAARSDAALTIRRALETNRIVNFYQPKVDAHLGTLLGMEALVRVRDEGSSGGFLMPGEFIHHVENTDIINDLGIRIIKSALADLREWNSKGMQTKVAINISARQLRSEDFAAQIFQLLESEPTVHPSQIIFELVETSGIADMDRAKRTLSRLADLGIEFQLDDFGTGFSSFAYLSQLPFSALKIDQTFVRNIKDERNDCIVKACIAIAQGHKIRAIAEGVETVEIAQRLLSMGCSAMQGYLIGRPMPKPVLDAWLQKHRVASGKRDNTVFIKMGFGPTP